MKRFSGVRRIGSFAGILVLVIGLPTLVYCAEGGLEGKLPPPLPGFTLECRCNCPIVDRVDGVFVHNCTVKVNKCNAYDFKIVMTYFDLAKGRTVTQEMTRRSAFSRPMEGWSCSTTVYDEILVKNSTGVTAELVCIDMPGRLCKDAPPTPVGALKKTWRGSITNGCTHPVMADTFERSELLCAGY